MTWVGHWLLDAFAQPSFACTMYAACNTSLPHLKPSQRQSRAGRFGHPMAVAGLPGSSGKKCSAAAPHHNCWVGGSGSSGFTNLKPLIWAAYVYTGLVEIETFKANISRTISILQSLFLLLPQLQKSTLHKHKYYHHHGPLLPQPSPPVIPVLILILLVPVVKRDEKSARCTSVPIELYLFIWK